MDFVGLDFQASDNTRWKTLLLYYASERTISIDFCYFQWRQDKTGHVEVKLYPHITVTDVSLVYQSMVRQNHYHCPSIKDQGQRIQWKVSKNERLSYYAVQDAMSVQIFIFGSLLGPLGEMYHMSVEVFWNPWEWADNIRSLVWSHTTNNL